MRALRNVLAKHTPATPNAEPVRNPIPAPVRRDNKLPLSCRSCLRLCLRLRLLRRSLGRRLCHCRLFRYLINT